MTQLDTYPIQHQAVINWGDMDAFQHVNNVAYFRYFENARIAYFQAVQALELMAAQHIGPILAETRCRFRKPLTYPDTIIQAARISALGRDRFTMEYAIYSETQQALVAEGEGRIVMLNYQTGAKVDLPETIRQRILELEPQTPQPIPDKRPPR